MSTLGLPVGEDPEVLSYQRAADAAISTCTEGFSLLPSSLVQHHNIRLPTGDLYFIAPQMTHSAFFYGTLLHPSILRRVIGHEGAQLRICPALLLVSAL